MGWDYCPGKNQVKDPGGSHGLEGCEWLLPLQKFHQLRSDALLTNAFKPLFVTGNDCFRAWSRYQCIPEPVDVASADSWWSR